jgi:hypothetical protein
VEIVPGITMDIDHTPPEPRIVAAAVNPPDGTPMDALPEPEPEPEPKKPRGVRYGDALVSSMKKSELVEAWKLLSPSPPVTELEWDGAEKVMRTALVRDVTALVNAGCQPIIVVEPVDIAPTPPESSSRFVYVESDAQKIDAAVTRFPDRFGLREFPGSSFYIERAACFVSEGRVMLYTYVYESGLAFSKGTEDELRREIVSLPKTPEPVVEEAALALNAELGSSQEPAPVVQDAPEPRLSLYIGCVPRGRTVVYLDQLLRPYQELVEQDAAVPHYSLILYAEGPKRVAAALRMAVADGSIQLPPELVVDRRHPCAAAVLDVIIPVYGGAGDVIERMG